MKQKKYKKCPRCGKKMLVGEARCESCGLIFERLNKATNHAGKIALSKGERNKVIYVTNLPSDVNKVKLLLFAIFFGLFGVQYAHVGRKKMFAFCFFSFFYLFVYTILFYFALVPQQILTGGYTGLIFELLNLPGGVAVIFWIVSIFQIIFNKFKVPVSIDEEYFVDTEDDKIDKEVAQNIINEVKLSRQNTNLTNKNSKKRKVFCANCGEYVKIMEGDTVCPNCDEPLKK